jgi:chitodextrinase
MRIHHVFVLVVAVGLTRLAAAEYCVRAGASGADDGSDWNNAFTALPAALVRGATYFVAGGSYPRYTSAADDGSTSTITIKKAIASDHGTGTGWTSAYGIAAATFNGTVAIRRSHVVFDGQTGGGPGSWTSGFGFRIAVTSKTAHEPGLDLVDMNASDYVGPSYVTTRHFEVIGDGGDGDQNWPNNDAVAIGNTASGNILISHAYLHDMGRTLFIVLGANPLVVEYVYCGKYEYTWGEHSEIASTNGDGITFRYDIFTSVTGTGGLMFNGQDNRVYGNVFHHAAGDTSWGYAANGIIGAKSSNEPVRNTLICNNTFIDTYPDDTGGGPQIFGMYLSNYPGNVAYDNLFYGHNAPLGDLGGVTHDYNAFVDFTGDVLPVEAHRSTAAGDPFRDPAHADFTLTANTAAGIALGSPYDHDALGRVRATWTRGAYEYLAASGDAQAPTAPTGLGATAVSRTRIDLSWTASIDDVGVTGYRVFRDGTQVGSPAGTAFSDTGLSPATAYSYAVKAIDAAGNLSAASAGATATTRADQVPVASAQSVATTQGVAKAITLVATDADGDALSYAIVAAPQHGTLSGSGASRTYTPAGGYSGSDSFAFKANDGIADSNTATVGITVAALGAGTGLAATYYDAMDLTGAAVQRTDPTVDFDWGAAAPASGIAVGTWSARWTGQVQAPSSQTYTFSVTGDDGVRLWVDGVKLVDQWQDHGPTTYDGSIALIAGRKYDLVMEYYQDGGSAVARLAWSSPSMAKQIVPTTQLFPVALPGSWMGRDVGATGATGSVSWGDGTATVTGGGADIWGAADAFQFVSQPLTGDGSIVARVVSQQDTDPWAKAGVMVREGIAAGARHAFCCVTAGNGVAFQRRTATDGASSHTAGSTNGAPRWVKLVRQGASLTGYESADGQAWTLVGTAALGLANPVQIGLAVTSHHQGVLCTAVFDHVAVTPGGNG